MNTPIQEAAIEPQPKGPVMLVCFACATQLHTVRLPQFVSELLGGMKFFYCVNEYCLHYGVLTVGTREKQMPPPPAPAAPAVETVPVTPVAAKRIKRLTKTLKANARKAATKRAKS